jgi:hypothetical protein
LFLQAFEDAGFHDIRLAKRERQPWLVAGGIAFRAVTVLAYKPAEGTLKDGPLALIYRGPFKKVEDDFGQVFARGYRNIGLGSNFSIAPPGAFRGSVRVGRFTGRKLPEGRFVVLRPGRRLSLNVLRGGEKIVLVGQSRLPSPHRGVV